MDVIDLAKLAKVDRGKLAKFERGEDAPKEPWINRVERALEAFEVESGHEPGEGVKPKAGGLIRVTVEDLYGAKALYVEGPVDNPEALADAVAAIMRRLGREAGSVE